MLIKSVPAIRTIHVRARRLIYHRRIMTIFARTTTISDICIYIFLICIYKFAISRIISFTLIKESRFNVSRSSQNCVPDPRETFTRFVIRLLQNIYKLMILELYQIGDRSTIDTRCCEFLFLKNHQYSLN